MIDCLDEHFDEAVEFWSEALGLAATVDDGRYVTLGEIRGPLFIRLQRVKTDAGFHLDIETDDFGAERKRLEAAGGIEAWIGATDGDTDRLAQLALRGARHRER